MTASVTDLVVIALLAIVLATGLVVRVAARRTAARMADTEERIRAALRGEGGDLGTRLAEWHAALWPDVVAICPHAGDALEGYATARAAREAIVDPSSQGVRRCTCGLFHVRRNARRGARRTSR
ncbi:hypothetical protein [Planobispora rosea]|uniref:hypothetical protein n=1 Tax=Planobispora rosea TaxID=35762 RepID=UPI00083A57B6|nr:hypothetical protein [Planobispora rosea]